MSCHKVCALPFIGVIRNVRLIAPETVSWITNSWYRSILE